MTRPSLRTLGLSSAIGLGLLWAGCGNILGLDEFADASFGGGDGNSTSGSNSGGDGGGGADSGGSLVITSPSTKMGALRAQVLTANQLVTWSVKETNGGRIDNNGRYLSPEIPGEYTVIATSTTDPTKFGSKTISVVPLGIEILGGKAGGRGTLDGPTSMARFEVFRGLGNTDSGLIVSDYNSLRKVYNNEVITIADVVTADPTRAPKTNEIANPTIMATNANDAWIVGSSGTCIRHLNAATNEIESVSGKCGTSVDSDNALSGDDARFKSITSIVYSAPYNKLYVCDGGRIRRVNPQTGAVKAILTFTGSAEVGTSCDYLSEHYTELLVYRQTESKAITTVPIFSGETFEDESIPDCSVGPDMRCVKKIDFPTGFNQVGISDIAYVGNDNFLYFASYSELSRCKYEAEGTALTACEKILSRDVAHPGEVIDGTLGVAPEPTIHSLPAIFADSSRFYWGDFSTIRQLNGNKVSTLAGLSGNVRAIDGNRAETRIAVPYSLALSGDGKSVFVSDILGDNCMSIRTLNIHDGSTSRFSGAECANFDDGFSDGESNVATFGMLVDMKYHNGSLFAMDGLANAIRKISTSGTVTTFVGKLNQSGYEEGQTGLEAMFNFLGGYGFPQFATDNTYFYVADSGNHAIRRIEIGEGDIAGAVTTLAGGENGTALGDGSNAQFMSPSGIAYDDGVLYVADIESKLIRQVTQSGKVSAFLGIQGSNEDIDGGVSKAAFANPSKLQADGMGNLYILGADEDSCSIRRIDIASRTVHPFIGTPGLSGIVAGPIPGTIGCSLNMGIDANGDLIFVDTKDGVVAAVRPL